jgi:membrane associated rhomboid family serine protease
LIGINMAAAFALLVHPPLIQTFGFHPLNPRAYCIVTGLFLHASLLHLLGNMLFLAAVGPAVELAVGKARFLLVYFLGGMVGVAAYWSLTGSIADPKPLVGASGCIAACVGYYSVRYSRMKVPVLPSVGVPVLAISGVWLTLQFVGGMENLLASPVDVAFWAHIGGFFVGLLLSFVYGAPALARVQFHHEVLEKMNDRSPGASLTTVEQILRDSPDDTRALREKAEALRLLGDHDEEADTLDRLVHVLPESEQPDLLLRLAELDELGRLAPIQRSLLAERFRTNEPELARLLLQSVLQEVDAEPHHPDALLALASLEKEVAPERAEPLLEKLFDQYPLHPASEVARARGWAL